MVVYAPINGSYRNGALEIGGHFRPGSHRSESGRPWTAADEEARNERAQLLAAERERERIESERLWKEQYQAELARGRRVKLIRIIAYVLAAAGLVATIVFFYTK